MSSRDALSAKFTLIKGVRALLLADATLPPLLNGNKIMARAPSSAPTPYIEIDARSTDYSTATEDGEEIQLTLHTWHENASQTPETATAQAIMGHIRRILHNAAPTLDAPFHCVLLRVENDNGPYQDPDGAVMHGVTQVRAIVDHS